MRVLAIAASVLILSVAFAGCAENSKEKSQDVKSFGGGRAVKAVNRTAIEQRLNRSIATSGEEKPGDWFVLSASASPAGNLTGFRFNLPEGALVVGGGILGRGSSLSMEVVPILVGPPENIQEWILLPYVLDAGRARLLQQQDPFQRLPRLLVEVPRTQADLALPAPGQKEIPISVAPRFITYSDDQLRAPGAIFIVVGAKSTTPVDFGIALRILDHRPAPQEQPSPDLEAILDEMGRAIPFGLKKTGTGTGFLAALYESQVMLAGGTGQAVQNREERTTTVKVEDRTAVRQLPATSIRDGKLSSGYDGQQGWTYVHGFYLGYCAVGKWSADIQVYGKSHLFRTLTLHPILCGAFWGALVAAAFGNMDFRVVAEGTGEAKSAIELTYANVSLENLRYVQISLGATLHTLIGHSAKTEAVSNQGLAGANVPPGAALEGTDGTTAK